MITANITHSEDTDNKPEFYMITFIDKEGKLNFCHFDCCGYPYYSPDFTFDRVYYSKKTAERDINCWNQFDMWKPEVGFTDDNVKIQKLVMYLTND